MNKIDELIREYYPDGVEIRYLEDCCNCWIKSENQ